MLHVPRTRCNFIESERASTGRFRILKFTARGARQRLIKFVCVEAHVSARGSTCFKVSYVRCHIGARTPKKTPRGRTQKIRSLPAGRGKLFDRKLLGRKMTMEHVARGRSRCRETVEVSQRSVEANWQTLSLGRQALIFVNFVIRNFEVVGGEKIHVD